MKNYKKEIIKYLKDKKIIKSLIISNVASALSKIEITKGGQDHIGPFKVWGKEKKDLTSRLSRHKEYRKRLFHDFEKQLLKYYDKIVSVVHDIAPKIGAEIPVTNDLRVFERAFDLLEVADR
ncbi:MAG: hypothetical protein HRT88_06040, partial [Lentisphaeraceae bacterium]|nr:hypothetical protein [Lentisphaeraceae bacterium]